MKEVKQLNLAHNLCDVTVRNIVECMSMIRMARWNASSNVDPAPQATLPVQVNWLLRLLRYLLIEGSICMTLQLMQHLWNGMLGLIPEDAEEGTVSPPQAALVSVEDREMCFNWFSQLPSKAINPDDFRTFFDQNIVKVDPVNLTSSGMKLFQNFFFQINLSNGIIPAELVVIGSGSQFKYLMDDAQLHGIEHIWRMLLDSPTSVAAQAMELLQQLYSNFSPRLVPRRKEIIEDLLQTCFSRLKCDYDTVAHTLHRHSAWVGSSFFFSVTYYSPMNETRSPNTHIDPPAQSRSHVDPSSSMSDTILFPAHANMTIGELRAQLLALRLPSLCGRANPPPSSQSMIPTTDLYHPNVPLESIDSRATDLGSQNYKLELYANPAREPTNPSATTTGFPLGGVLIDPAADEMPVLCLLTFFHEWPGIFLKEPSLDRVLNHEEIPPRLSLVANVVLVAPQLSYDFYVDGLRSCLRKEPTDHTILQQQYHEQQMPRPTQPPTGSETQNSHVPDLTNPEVVPTTSDQVPQFSTSDVPAGATGIVNNLASISVTDNSPNQNRTDRDGPSRPASSDSFEFNSSAQRSQFLLQLAKVAMELNSDQLFSSVLDVLLCLPAPESLIERLQSEIATAALAAVPRIRKLTTDEVGAQLTKSPLQETYLEDLLSAKHIDNDQPPTTEDMSRLMELYYALQVLYSLCLPTAAITQCHDMFALVSNDSRTLSQQSVFHKLPLWYNASQLTVHFLRAGGLSLIMSCPLLSPRPRDKERSTTGSDVVYQTIVDLIRLWLVRLLRLLLTMCAFTLVALRPQPHMQPKNNCGIYESGIQLETTTTAPDPCTSPAVSVPEEHSSSVLTQRVIHLCDSFKSPVRVNNPVTGGGFFLVRHSDWVSRVAVSLGVSFFCSNNVYQQFLFILGSLLYIIRRFCLIFLCVGKMNWVTPK
ncbi:unnamed protein product [Echinostoma caproni]|uniref:SEC7 domain-containing protein n=1 Tax=Echinostoma caproni TaxID=27848 RepID=A0A183AKY8_9TREM|nr:unnamed protein product [Echinostoma caproni]